jgi:hypothetical protein
MSRESSSLETSGQRPQMPGITLLPVPGLYSQIDVRDKILDVLPVCVEWIDLRGFVTYQNPAARTAWSLEGIFDPYVPWLMRWCAASRLCLHEAMLQAQIGSRCRVVGARLVDGHVVSYEVTLNPQTRSLAGREMLAVSMPVRPGTTEWIR